MPKSLALRIVQSDDESMGRLQPGWLAQQVGLKETVSKDYNLMIWLF